MHSTRRKLLPVAAALLLVFSAAGYAKTVKLSGTFVGEHGATNQPTGHVKASLNTTTHKLKYTIVYGGLSGPVTIAHFHGPAKAKVDAGVLQKIDGPYHSGMKNSVVIDTATQSAMLDGMTYVNLHTDAHPKGEARAQMTIKK